MTEKKKEFNPTREQIKTAVEEFLKSGGSIDTQKPKFDDMPRQVAFKCKNDDYSWRSGPSPRTYEY